MPKGKGGAGRNQGPKPIWGPSERSVKIGVPSSIQHDLRRTIEYLWNTVGLRGSELSEALLSLESTRIRKYDPPASAGLGYTGQPISESDNFEEINLYSELIPDSKEVFILPVVGESMIDIGIYPEDWLVVRRTKSPNDRDIVIVSINDETLVKRYTLRKGKPIFLSENAEKSENAEYQPIFPSEEMVCEIAGVVTTVIRKNPARASGARRMM
ncbi:MAG: LexA family protein [Spirulinaceae cyanobacterium]